MRSHPEPGPGVLVVGPITRADVPLLCERLRLLVHGSGVEVVACDVRALAADVVAIEALARLALTARRLGCRVRLRRLSRELKGLLDLCGLADALPSLHPARTVDGSTPGAPVGGYSGEGGRPKSGNMRAVSRKELIAVIWPPETSIT